MVNQLDDEITRSATRRDDAILRMKTMLGVVKDRAFNDTVSLTGVTPEAIKNNPWTAVGIAFGLGAAGSLVLTTLIPRERVKIVQAPIPPTVVQTTVPGQPTQTTYGPAPAAPAATAAAAAPSILSMLLSAATSVQNMQMIQQLVMQYMQKPKPDPAYDETAPV